MVRILHVVLIHFICDYFISFDAMAIYHSDWMNHPDDNILQPSDSADLLAAAQTISIETKKLFVTGMLFM